MGLGRVICSGCVGMLSMIPMSWIAFGFFDLAAAVTGGLITELGNALNTYLPQMIEGPLGQALPILLGGVAGLICVLMFPIHWLLIYRPDNMLWALAVMIPWVLSGFITSYLFAHSVKGGFNTGFAIGLGYAIPGVLLLGLISNVPGVGGVVTGLFTGLTDLPPALAIGTACIEGGLIGGVFGALAGALRYDPATLDQPPAAKKQKKGKVKSYDPIGGPSTVKFGQAPPMAPAGQQPTTFCMNCGGRLPANARICPDCGSAQ